MEDVDEDDHRSFFVSGPGLDQEDIQRILGSWVETFATQPNKMQQKRTVH